MSPSDQQVPHCEMGEHDFLPEMWSGRSRVSMRGTCHGAWNRASTVLGVFLRLQWDCYHYQCYVTNSTNFVAKNPTILLGVWTLWVRDSESTQQGWLISVPGCLGHQQGRFEIGAIPAAGS